MSSFTEEHLEFAFKRATPLISGPNCSLQLQAALADKLQEMENKMFICHKSVEQFVG